MRALKQVGQFAVVALVALVGNQATNALDGHAIATLVVGVATAVLALVAYGFTVRWTERRRVDEVAPRGAARPITTGTVVGVAMFAAVVLAVALHGDFHVHGWGSVPGAVGLVGIMAAAAATEELMFRGVLFRAVQERTGTWVALIATGALFGGMHLLNPDATPWGGAAIAIEAGGMLGAAYLATGKLWLPIGLHLGWNFAEGGIFSSEVSGNGSSQGLLDSSVSGSTVVTGGTFGPEASVYAVACCLAVTIVLLVVAHRRGRIVPFSRARRAALAAASAAPAATASAVLPDRPSVGAATPAAHAPATLAR